MVVAFDSFKPCLGYDTFIAPTATVIGRVTIEDSVSIWYGCVVRGDTEVITIGKETNVQDLTVIHADVGKPVTIGRRVTIGHRAIVHGCTIEDECLIGMGSIIQNGARIGRNSIVASGSVVRENFEVPPGSLVMGVPAIVKRPLTPDEIAYLAKPVEIYLKLARGYLKK
jgi:carbonic anhydrase/acetyltransferase-like protein (isoleucine patch superfamily)